MQSLRAPVSPQEVPHWRVPGGFSEGSRRVPGGFLDTRWCFGGVPKRDLKKVPSPGSRKVRSGNYLLHFSKVSGLRKGHFWGTILESILETNVTQMLHMQMSTKCPPNVHKMSTTCPTHVTQMSHTCLHVSRKGAKIAPKWEPKVAQEKQ